MLAELIEKIAGWEPKQSKFYPRPSMAGPEQCLRKLVYMAKGYPGKVVADRFHLILDDSSWHEELTLDWLRKSAFKVHSEQLEIECGEVLWNNRPFIMKGHIDALVTDMAGQDYLLEHKAINHFSFQRYLEKDFPMDYLTQCRLYIQGLQKISPIKNGFLLIKNKNNAQYLEYNFTVDTKKDLLIVNEVVGSNGFRREGASFEGLYNQAIERMNLVERYKNSNELPPRQYGINDWQCSYCQFNDICYENYEEEFAEINQIQLPQDFEGLLEEYLSLQETKKAMEARADEIKEELKQYLSQQQAKSGKCKGFVVSRDLVVRKKLNPDKIPDEIKANAWEETIFETLRVSKANNKTKK